jgi:hypothetical protein
MSYWTTEQRTGLMQFYDAFPAIYDASATTETTRLPSRLRVN